MFEAKRASVRSSLQSEIDCIQELQRVIHTEEVESGSFPWQATQAGLARIYTEIHRSTEALAIYEILEEKPYQFPESTKPASQTQQKKGR